MAHSLKDRIQLRQLRNALNTKLFGEQNKMLAQKNKYGSSMASSIKA